MSESLKISFPAYLREEFASKLEKVNKKLRKIKGATDVTLLEETSFAVTKGEDALGNPLFVDFLEVTVELPTSVKHRGFEYKGTISYKDGVKTIFSVPGASVAHIEHRKCDHCGHNRQRNLVHVFDRKGKDFTIGSKCVEEYFGLEVFKALNVFNGFVTAVAELEKDNWRGGYHVYGNSRDSLLGAIACAYITNSCYVKTKQFEYDEDATIEVVNGILRQTSTFVQSVENARKAGSVDLKALPQLLIDTYGNLDPKASDFNSNIVNALFVGDNKELREFFPCKVTGLVVWAVYNALNKKAKANAPKRVNEYIGKVGEKITVQNAKVLSARAMGSFGYNGPTSYLFTFDTPQGTVKCFTTNETICNLNDGAVVNLTGKVKKHEEWKGYKSTMLNYAKVAK
jgi:hypothetical protein